MMLRTAKTIDISDLPDLRRVAEEVREANEPYLFRAGNEDVALLIPVRGDGSMAAERRTTGTLFCPPLAAGKESSTEKR
jgi:hypothetical protein